MFSCALYHRLYSPDGLQKDGSRELTVGKSSRLRRARAVLRKNGIAYENRSPHGRLKNWISG